MNREDLELYVTGNFDGDVEALEREIGEDPALAAAVAEEARFEMQLRDAVAAATFCVACEEIVRHERCDNCGAAVRPGGYTVERVLVSNAHGRMYVARDADGKQVALKELAFVQAPSRARIEAFEREAKFLRALEHPAIPRFVASFEDGQGIHTRYYLAQELVEGTPLDRIENKWYSEEEIIEIARRVLGVLVYLQSLSPMVIHRDVKPANLVRRADGSIALVDFGAAYVDGATAGLTTVGTFGYMPIEQLAGIVDATTDLYGLGASLLYLLTRQEPWRLAQNNTTVNVSVALRAYLNKLTATDPRERFVSAQEALTMLDRRMELVKNVATKRPPLNLRKNALWMIAGAGVIVGGVAAGMMIRERRLEQQQKAAAVQNMATLRISLPPDVESGLYIDGEMITKVRHASQVPLLPGKHQIELRGGSARCNQEIDFAAGKTTTVECVTVKPSAGPEVRLDNTTPVSWSFKDAPLHDLLGIAAKSCGLNMVIPDDIGGKVTAQLTAVPCNQALETVLEAQGLWYVFDKGANVVRIGPRRHIDTERAEEAARPPSIYPRLPEGGATVDMDFKDAPLRDLTPMLTVGVGKMNIVIPDDINTKTTVYLKNVPWNRAFEAVLEAHGLWYRYREEGKIIRIAPRRHLDAEEAEERARSGK